MNPEDQLIALKLEIVQMLLNLEDPALLPRVREVLLSDDTFPQPLAEQSEQDTPSDE